MRPRKHVAATAVASAAPAIPAAAHADTTPPPAGATTLPAGATTIPSIALNFVPPSVAPISVDLGVTIINGKVVHVLMPGVKLPPITRAWPPTN